MWFRRGQHGLRIAAVRHVQLAAAAAGSRAHEGDAGRTPAMLVFGVVAHGTVYAKERLLIIYHDLSKHEADEADETRAVCFLSLMRLAV